MTIAKFFCSAPVRILISVLCVAAIWQVLAAYVIKSDLVFASLTSIFARMATLAENGQLWTNIRVSGAEFLLGYAAAAIFGIILGVALALNRTFATLAGPWMGALYATPMIALAPIFVVLMGIGIYSKVAIIFIEAFFQIAVNTSLGIRSTSADLTEAARAFGASHAQVIRTVLLPNALPFIVAGMRIAVARALAGVLISEIFGSEAGIGNLIWFSAEAYDMPSLFTGVFVLAGSSIVLMSLLGTLEKRLAPWRKDAV
ncbi:MAG TPA: ABC transporter permease [Stellaceae bacterium]|nr:ABC transporter permease [Stellaceae bacterium]